MPSGSAFAEVRKEIDRMNQAAGSVEDFMWETVKLLHDRMLKYNWVGFYMLENKPRIRNHACWRWDPFREP